MYLSAYLGSVSTCSSAGVKDEIGWKMDLIDGMNMIISLPWRTWLHILVFLQVKGGDGKGKKGRWVLIACWSRALYLISTFEFCFNGRTCRCCISS